MLFGLSKIWSLKLLVIKLDDTSCPRITQKSFNTPYYFCHQTRRSSQGSKVYLQICTVFLCHVQLSRCRPVSKQKFVTVWNRNVVFLMKFPSFSVPKFVIWKGDFPIFVTGCTAIMKTSNGSWCMGIKDEMSGTVCVTFRWDMYVYIWVVYSLCFFCCLFITVTWWYVWCIEWASDNQEEVQACLVTLWLFIISCYSLYKTTLGLLCS